MEYERQPSVWSRSHSFCGQHHHPAMEMSLRSAGNGHRPVFVRDLRRPRLSARLRVSASVALSCVPPLQQPPDLLSQPASMFDPQDVPLLSGTRDRNNGVMSRRGGISMRASEPKPDVAFSTVTKRK